MPVGPMSALCLRRTLAEGRRAGLAFASGIAAADGLYAAVAAFGLTALSRPLLAFASQIEIAGGLALVAIGGAGMFARPAPVVGPLAPGGAARLAAGALLLTLANPATIVVFAAIFAAGALPRYAGFAPSALLVAGAFTGSLLWWVALTAVASAVRTRLPRVALRAMNVAAGGAIVAFGLLVLWAAARHP